MTTRINFIFKNNQYRKLIGGLMPSNEIDDVYIKSSKGYYYLAEANDIDFWRMSKWDPMPVNDQVVAGFPLIDVVQLPEDPSDPNSAMRNLTTQEQEDKHAAEKALKKMETRAKIHGQVGDIYDLVTDLSKRVGLMERVTLRTLEFLYNSSSISSEIPQAYKDGYSGLLTQYVNDINSGNYRDRVDIEDNAEMYARLQVRFNDITRLVDEYLQY